MSEDDRCGLFAISYSVLQGSVLGPVKFIAYSEDVVELFSRYRLSDHLFADDK